MQAMAMEAMGVMEDMAAMGVMEVIEAMEDMADMDMEDMATVDTEVMEVMDMVEDITDKKLVHINQLKAINHKFYFKTDSFSQLSKLLNKRNIFSNPRLLLVNLD